MRPNKYSKLQIFVIILLFTSIAVQGFTSVNRNPVLWDELCYVGAGKAIFSTGYMRYMVLIGAPPLSYYISSLPLIPLRFNEKIWDNNSCWKIGHEVLFNSGYDTQRILFASRIPFILLSMLVAVFVLKWATQLYGKKSGIVALFLYSFSPSLIAYSSIVTVNFTTAAMIFIATYYFWKLIKEPSNKNLILVGVFFGLSLLSKIISIILIPLFIIIGILAVYKKEKNLKLKTLIKNLLIIFLIALILIFAFYKFQFGTFNNSLPPGYYTEKSREEIKKLPLLSDIAIFVFEKVPVSMPMYFGMIGDLVYLSRQNKDNFVFGQIVQRVPWYFALLTFVLKTQIALMVMLILFVVLYRKLKRMDYITNLLLILPILLLFISLLNSSKTSGVGHILLVYPFIFVLVSNIVNIRMKRKNIFSLIISVLLFSYSISTILVAPNYLSYINLLGGGPDSVYKIMVGSNTDQGQGILDLKEYMEKNSIDKIKLSYWGSIDPKDYNVNYEYMPSPYFQPWQSNYWQNNLHLDSQERNIKENCSERKGLIAISITNLQNVHLVNKTCYEWLKKHEPVEKIGHSIFIYDVK